MELLVSVRDIDEAAAAVAGGAGIIDGKEPAAGALGPVAPALLREIASISRPRLVTAALGDATSEEDVERAAATYIRHGAALIKIGFAGTPSRAHVEQLLRAASRGAGLRRVIAVAYADFALVAGPAPSEVLEAALLARVTGVLLDTAVKDGPGTLDLIAPPALKSLVDAAKRSGLIVAVAGKLGLEDLQRVEDLGADVAGVRGAACDGGRNGEVNVARVRELCARVYRERNADPRPALVAPAI
jgi:uncharacterized protein (UPF0264 family)